MIFTGMSAFPLTPMDERGVDEAAFVGLVAPPLGSHSRDRPTFRARWAASTPPVAGGSSKASRPLTTDRPLTHPKKEGQPCAR